MLELPLIPETDESRTYDGQVATSCGCNLCQMNCRHVPGMVTPDDLRRLAKIYPDRDTFLRIACNRFLASPGALVAKDAKMFRIPTIVMARRSRLPGDPPLPPCVAYRPDGSCAIHSEAPAGCRFFDAHEDALKAMARSAAMLREIMLAWSRNDDYAMLWTHLQNQRLQAAPVEEAREQMEVEYRDLHRRSNGQEENRQGGSQTTV